ncbi:MAG TPA: HAD family phosphatase [Terriglobales bacterium]|nr:HAD family phosphatase [Terriglobales bacterium]
MPVNGHEKLPNLKAVIFDYGNVLCLPPTREDIEGSARILGIPPGRFQVLWSRHRDRYDRGDLSRELYWKQVAEDAGTPLQLRQLQDLAERDVIMWSRTQPAMIAWLEDLSASGMKTAVLSNMHADMIRHVRDNFAWLKRVNSATFSAEVRLIKPEPAIYEHCLRGLGVAPAETLFIDDREVNLRAAQAIGIHGIHFRSVGELCSELEAAGFPTLLPKTPSGSASAD